MADERRIIELVLRATGDAELKRITRELVELKGSAQKSQQSLEQMAAGMKSAFRVIKEVVGFEILREAFRKTVEIVGESVDAMYELTESIQKVGIAAKDLQRLQYAAKQSGLGADELNKAVVRLAVNMEGLSGKNTAATAALRKLGIEAGTTTLAAMEKIAAQFAKMPDGAQKTALAVQYFGRAGAELIPLLNEGAAGIAKMAEESDKLGNTLNGEALAGAKALHEEFVKFDTAMAGAKNQIVAGLSPALVTLIQLLLNGGTATNEFRKFGEMLGKELVHVAEYFAGLSALVGAHIEALGHLSAAYKAAAEGASAFWHGDIAGVRAAAKLAGDELAKFKTGWDGAAKAQDAAMVKVARSYASTRIEIAKTGLELSKQRKQAQEDAKTGTGGKSATKQAADDTLDFAKANQVLNESLAKLRDQFDKAEQAQKDYAAGLERAANPLIAYTEGMAKLHEAQATVGVTADAARVEQERLEKQLKDATQALNDNSAASQKAAADQEAHQKQLEKVREQWGFLSDAIGQAAYDAISGAQKIGQAVKQMVATIIRELARLAAQKLAMMIVGSLFGKSVTQFGNAGISGMGSLPININAKGNAFAAGGLVNGPTMFAYGGGIGVMGEAGPEAVMPLKRDSSGNLGVATSGGGWNVTVNNNVPSAAVAVRQTNDGLQIDLIERQLADRIRRGGSPLPGAIENTYRSGRGAGAFA